MMLLDIPASPVVRNTWRLDLGSDILRKHIDIPSHAYQFTFANNPLWSRFYAKGHEIHSYLKDVSWKYDVEKYVRFRHLFQKADWDDKAQKWRVEIKDLETGEVWFLLFALPYLFGCNK